MFSSLVPFHSSSTLQDKKVLPPDVGTSLLHIGTSRLVWHVEDAQCNFRQYHATRVLLPFPKGTNTSTGRTCTSRNTSHYPTFAPASRNQRALLFYPPLLRNQFGFSLLKISQLRQTPHLSLVNVSVMLSCCSPARLVWNWNWKPSAQRLSLRSRTYFQAHVSNLRRLDNGGET